MGELVRYSKLCYLFIRTGGIVRDCYSRFPCLGDGRFYRKYFMVNMVDNNWGIVYKKENHLMIWFDHFTARLCLTRRASYLAGSLSNEQEDQGCDARDDAMKNYRWQPIKNMSRLFND